MFKKSLALLLALLLLLSIFCSCAEQLPDPEPGNTEPIAQTTAPVTSDEDLSIDKNQGNQPNNPVPITYQNLLDYRVVIPKNCDLLTYYAGQNLVDYLKTTLGVTLTLVTDASAETACEFLIGKTSRPASTVNLSLNASQYLLMQKGQKIILQGDGIYVCAAVGAFVSHYLPQKDANGTYPIKNLPTEASGKTYTFPTVYRNAILMIGDGMGYEHVNAALANGLDSFVANELPVIGSSTTRSQSVLNGQADYTDSAAAATALACGYKTINGYLGKDAGGTDRQNVRELAQAFGAKTAIVTTDAITGATPAGFLCHNISRNNTSALQAEIDGLIANGSVDYCKGSVDDELTYHTRQALLTIADSSAPFFLMVEEGYIDKHSHNNDMNNTLYTVERFNDVIAYVIGFVFCHPDTALIITADHETGGITVANNSYGYQFTVGTHTNIDVPLYALGAGTEVLHGQDTENIDIARFIAKAFGAESFGQTAPVS